jgi:hypothetical protein
MKKAVLLALALLASMCGGSQPGATPSVTELSTGKLRIWFAAGDEALPMYTVDDKYYLLGTEGQRYEIGLENLTDGRLEVVVSVDGLDVISGKEADFQSQRGYVILPGEQIAVQGFRQSLNQVAAFRFAGAENSYAARMGAVENIGVIGAAVFEEVKRAPVAIAGAADSAAAQSAKGAAEETAEVETLGTEYGESIDSAAEIIPFERLSKLNPSEIIAVYYDDRQGLEGRGVVLPDDTGAARIAAPDPFPAVPEDRTQFAPPPPQVE